MGKTTTKKSKARNMLSIFIMIRVKSNGLPAQCFNNVFVFENLVTDRRDPEASTTTTTTTSTTKNMLPFFIMILNISHIHSASCSTFLCLDWKVKTFIGKRLSLHLIPTDTKATSVANALKEHCCYHAVRT